MIFAIGIGVANVLAPSVIKRDFPSHVGGMTTAYVMVMALTGAIADGVGRATFCPSRRRLALVARHLGGARRVRAGVLVAGNAQNEARSLSSESEALAYEKPIWRCVLAWQVAIFMGLQFLIYYVTVGWVPLFLADHGYSPAEAGWLLTLYQAVSFAVGLVAPALMRRGHDRRMLAVVTSLITALCMLGLLIAPGLAGLWLVICGGSFGITFILAFALIGMRTSDHRRAASLSTMSQATAYLIAAAGPVAFGWLRDIAAGWTIPMLSLVAVAAIQAVAGLGAGRQRQV